MVEALLVALEVIEDVLEAIVAGVDDSGP